MNYQETIDYLFSQLPMYQRQGKIAYKNDLTNIIALCKNNNNPELNFKSIHIAGTNEKGSVSHILASVSESSVYKVGLYTSPHLKDFRERIRINGKMISENEVIDFVERNLSLFSEIKPSFFEMSVAMAFDHFAKNKVDIAVIEVGMGGRLDSTNIIKPLVSVITNISFDHTQFLGKTLIEIAKEKAGIIKTNIPVVIGETQDETSEIFIKISKEANAPIYFADQEYHCDYAFLDTDYNQILNIKSENRIIYKNLKTDLLGIYQKHNVITALKVIDILSDQFNISIDSIYKGLLNVKKNTGLAGRWDILGYNPLIITDTGHNFSGMTNVVKQIESIPYKQLHFIYGTVNDKDISDILNILPKKAIYYFTKANIPRAMDENLLKKEAQNYGLIGDTYNTVSKAFIAAKVNASEKDLIFIGGSTFVVAEVI